MFYVFFSKSFEKEPKLFYMSFSLAQRKELKETSTSSKPPPIWGGLTDSGQSPPSVRFLVSLASLCPTGER